MELKKSYEKVMRLHADELNVYVLYLSNTLLVIKYQSELQVGLPADVLMTANPANHHLIYYSKSQKETSSSNGKLYMTSVIDGKLKNVFLFQISQGIVDIKLTENNLMVIYGDYVRIFMRIGTEAY